VLRLVPILALLAAGLAAATDPTPWWPSPVQTSHGGLLEPKHVAGSQSCGASGCHPDIAAQWDASAHHFSSFSNPFYRRAVERLMEEPDGVAKARWCGGCHDPALLLTGRMATKVTAEDPLAAEGVGCLLCHAIEPPTDARGNGGYTLRPVDPVPLDGSKLFAGLGRKYVKLRSGKHKSMLMQPHVRTAEMCRACHKVAIPTEVNDYHWKRGQNEYDRWHASGVSGHNSASFFLRRQPVDCIDCHMPEVESRDEGHDEGKVASHRFAAANTALPALRGDLAQLEAVEATLRRNALRVHVAAVAAPALGPLTTPEQWTPQGEDELRLYVVVRNANVGHAFPGGTIDSQEAWLHVRVQDGSGRTLLESGAVAARDAVPDDVRSYRARILSAHSESLVRRDVDRWIATGYARTVGPGEADVARYRLRLPADAVLPLQVSARLLYRKFQPAFSDFVFDGEIPELPITEMALTELTLGAQSALPAAADLADRWNDLGIALFLQEDRVRAADCFERAAAAAPERVDLVLNQARVALGDGDLPKARGLLDRAATMEADHPTLLRLRSRLFAAEGAYAEAIGLLSQLLDADPLDRGAWAELAEARYFAGDFAAALEAYDRILEIDPEALNAHNGRLLSLRALGLASDEAEAAVRRYKPPESETAIAGRWLRLQPIENRAAQDSWEFGVVDE
jgi:tetratricopeptide (TPR) repeat protein